MKSLIITVAGTSTRFNKDIREPTLKSLYFNKNPKYSLIYQILNKARDIDEYVIVGGYLFEKLELFIKNHLDEFKDKIKLIYNSEYSTFGSGYSLYLGILNCTNASQEIIFVEGDLYFDNITFEKVKNSPLNVFTVNHELILAKKAVVGYINTEEEIKYLYDPSHQYLQIKYPFLAIYNSGQVWKFIDVKKLLNVINSLGIDRLKGTNLEIIQRYFDLLKPKDYEMIVFSSWFNCNTIKDYEDVFKTISDENS